MLDKPARATNWRPADHSPPHELDDIELVEWGNDASFRRERAEWLRDVRRVGGTKLGPMREIVAIVADFMSAKNDTAWPSIDFLAADIGWSPKTVWRALQDAVRWGWLVKTRRPNSSNGYAMSFSVSVREAVVQFHAERIAEFKAKDRLRKEARTAAATDDGLVRCDETRSSGLTSRDRQVRPVGIVTPDELTYPRTSPIEPTHRTATDPLGETVQDTEAEPEQKKAVLDDVISALGRGDMEEGQRIANALAPARLAFVVNLAETQGFIAAASAITDARQSASPSH